MQRVDFNNVKQSVKHYVAGLINSINGKSIEKTDYESRRQQFEAVQREYRDELSERKNLAQYFTNRIPPTVTSEKGLKFFAANSIDHMESANNSIEKIVRNGLTFGESKPYLLQKPLDIDDPIISPIVNLITSDEILGAATHYLGHIPMVNYMLISYTPKDRTFDGGSQYYHLDGADFPLDQDEPTMIKFVMLASDADENSGPFTILTRDASKKAHYALVGKKRSKLDRSNPNWNSIIQHASRIDDETIYSHCDRDDAFALMGKKGTAILGDTNRCYHFGSRPGNKDRWIFFVQFARADTPGLFHGNDIERPLPNWLTNGLEPEEKRIRELLFQNYQGEIWTPQRRREFKKGELSTLKL